MTGVAEIPRVIEKIEKATHFRWTIVVLLFSITIINYLDRASISYAIEEMTRLYHFSSTQAGLILGAFGIGYVVTTFLGGISVDRYGPRITMLIAVMFWGVSLTLTGLATGFAIAFFSRVLLGFAEGPNFPSMTRAVGDWLPKNERAIALSYSLLAVPLALAIGGPIVSQLIVYIGWRGAFFFLAIIALLWIPFWWCLFRNFPEKSPHVNRAELKIIHHNIDCAEIDREEISKQRKYVKNLWSYLFSCPTLLANYWAFFVFGYFLFFFMTWLPSFLTQRYHMDLTKIGLFSILPWTFSALLMWGAGYLSDYILKKTDNYRWSRSYLIWISQLLAALSIIPLIFIHNEYWSVLFISLAVGFSMSANAAYYVVNIDIAEQRAGTAFGIMNASFALSGFIAPVMTGWTVSLTGSFTAAFVLLTLLALSSVVIVILFHHPDTAKRLNT